MIMKIEITEAEARHLQRLIKKGLTTYKSQQSVSEIRLRDIHKKLNKCNT